MLKSKSILLVDVRNRTEFNRVGKIPGSFILPLHEVKAGFELSPEKFLEKYEFQKPDVEALVMMTRHFLVETCFKKIRFGIIKSILILPEGELGQTSRIIKCDVGLTKNVVCVKQGRGRLIE
jgi:hypothetical protein